MAVVVASIDQLERKIEAIVGEPPVTPEEFATAATQDALNLLEDLVAGRPPGWRLAALQRKSKAQNTPPGGYLVSFPNWEPDHHHWVNSWIKIHANGAVELFIGHLANMKRTAALGDNGRDKSAIIHLAFYNQDTSPSTLTCGWEVARLSYRVDEGNRDRNYSFPNIAGAVQSSSLVMVRRIWGDNYDPPTPVIPFPPITF